MGGVSSPPATPPIPSPRPAPVGLISYRDAAALQRRAGFVVRDRMTPLADAVVVHRDDPLEAAWMELLGSPAGRALVLDAGRPPGLLSATDVSRILDARQRGAAGPPLRRVAA